MSPAESRRDLRTIQLMLQHQSLRISIRLEGGPVMSKEGKKEREEEVRERYTGGRELSWRERERRSHLTLGKGTDQGPWAVAHGKY